MFRKKITILVLLVLTIGTFNEVHGTNGPTQPEAAQFEPVDATDLVGMYSGNFTYNIPLLEIPGNEGGWPINLFYHAGIGPNQEASWVGLGWNINPGSINRFMNGYPDDYWGIMFVQNIFLRKERKRYFSRYIFWSGRD